MSLKKMILLGIVAVIIITIAVSIPQCLVKNNAQSWQIVQGLDGKLEVVNTEGWYWRWFPTVTTYPRYMDFRYNDDPDDGDKPNEVISITFNDGGNADISTFVRLMTPQSNTDYQISFHRQFAGSVPAVKAAVKAYLTNCLKTTAPLMSASENQSARKSEFSQIVEEQMIRGIYEMKQIERVLKDRFDDKGNPITVPATEIVIDKNTGKRLVSQISPITSDFHMSLSQFSVTATGYDKETLAQFAAKKQFFLKAEQNKAEKEQMVQERLKIVETGLRDKAEAEAIGNVDKAKAVVAAQKDADVALQKKIKAETEASQALEVAKIDKQEAETRANRDLEVARIKAEAALKQAEAIVTLATAEEKKIALAGAITEKDRTLAQIEAQKQVDIAKSLSNMNVPSVVFLGGGQGGGNSDYFGNLLSYSIMQQMGIVPARPVGPVDKK